MIPMTLIHHDYFLRGAYWMRPASLFPSTVMGSPIHPISLSSKSYRFPRHLSLELPRNTVKIHLKRSGGLVDDSPPHDSHQYSQLVQVVFGEGHKVSTQHHQIGQFAGLNGAEDLLLSAVTGSP